MSAPPKEHEGMVTEELDDDGAYDEASDQGTRGDSRESAGEDRAKATGDERGKLPLDEASYQDEPAWLRVKNMANQLLKAGYAKEAASAYKEALDIAPSEAEKAVLQANLALAYLKLREPRRVVSYCDEALAVLEKGGFTELSLRKEKLLLRKAAAFEMWDRHSEALAAAEAVLKSEPANVEARAIAQKCRAALGPAESDKALKKAMSKALNTDGGLYSEKPDAEEIRRKKLEDSVSKRVTEMFAEGEAADAANPVPKGNDILEMAYQVTVGALVACFDAVAWRCRRSRNNKKAGEAEAGKEESKED